jgi:hypothetical protein
MTMTGAQRQALMNDITALKETFVLTKVLYNEAKLWWQTREAFAGPVSAHHVLTLYSVVQAQQHSIAQHSPKPLNIE